MARGEHPNDSQLLLALRHPMRRRILRLMAGAEELSPRELSRALGQPLSNVSYHVRVLADCDAAALVRTRPVRGSTQHFYRSAIDEPWVQQVLDASEGEDRDSGEKPDG